MNERYLISIACENENGKWYEYEVYEDTIIGVSRILITYKPKRNYKVIQIHVRLMGV